MGFSIANQHSQIGIYGIVASAGEPCGTPDALYSNPFAFRTVWAAGEERNVIQLSFKDTRSHLFFKRVITAFAQNGTLRHEWNSSRSNDSIYFNAPSYRRTRA
jgi:hypothetical protein